MVVKICFSKCVPIFPFLAQNIPNISLSVILCHFGFITATVVNPPERKLAKRTSVQFNESLKLPRR